MKMLKNKWVLMALGLIVLAGLAWMFRKQLGPMLGGYEKSEKGFYYRFKEGRKLEKVQGPGYHIVFQYVLLGPDGDTLENKSMPGVEQQMEYPLDVRNELDEVFQIAAPGSVVEVLVPTDSLQARAGNNLKIMNLPLGKNAKWVIHMIKLLNVEEFEGYKNSRLMERLQKENKAIDDFAQQTKKPWQLDSAAWIKYYIENKTENPRFMDGDEVEFNAEVYTLSGNLLMGKEGRKYKMTVGRFNYPLVAFDKVITYLADGENGVFLVTSDYGYGAEGLGAFVPPYTPLLVKMFDVKKIK